MKTRRTKLGFAEELQQFCKRLDASEVALCAAILIAILQDKIHRESEPGSAAPSRAAE